MCIAHCSAFIPDEVPKGYRKIRQRLTSRAAKVCGTVGTPQNSGFSALQALVKQLGHVILEAVPRPVHVPVVEARVPCTELCMHGILS